MQAIPRIDRDMKNSSAVWAIIACLAACISASFIGSSTRNAELFLTSLVMVSCVVVAFFSAPLAIAVMLASGRTGIGPFDGTVFDIAFCAALGLVGANIFTTARRKRLADLVHPIALSQLSFVFIVLLSYLNTRGYGYAHEKTLRVFFYGLLFVVLPVWYFARTSKLGPFFVCFIVIADAMGMTALLWTLRTSSLSGLQRINAPSGGPITLARILALGAIACVTLALVHRKYRFLLLLNGIALLVETFATGSRGPALFLLLVTFSMPWISVFSSQLRAMSPRLIVGLLVVIVAAIPIWHRLESSNLPFAQRFSLLTQSDRGVSVDLREDNYQLAIDAARESSWQANGTGYWAVLLGDGDAKEYPHNVFLEILLEQGIVGLGLFILFVVSVLGTGVRCLNRSDQSVSEAALTLGAFSCFIFALLAAQTSGDLYDNRAIWFFGGVMLALRVSSPVAKVSTKDTRSPSARIGVLSTSRRGRAGRISGQQSTPQLARLRK
jgi:O-antigen ligase